MRKEIIGDAVKGAQWLRWGILEHSKKKYGRHAVENGDIIIEIEPEYVRVIMPDLSGFQLWPRYGNIVNLTVESSTEDAYDLKVTEFGGTYIGEEGSSIIYDRSPYPMTFDAIRGTFIAEVSKQDDPEQRTTEVIFNGGFMANCFWTDGEDKILNWRGTPNRHFSIPAGYAIPGVTDGVTPFGTWIYEGGEQLIEAPDGALVTGAFYRNDILYCISYLESSERVHYLEDSMWILKGERSGGSPLIPCFISADGTKFVSGDGVTVLVEENELIYLSNLSHSGQQSYVFGGGYWQDCNFSANGRMSLWPELDDTIEIITTATCDSLSDSTGSSSTKDVPVKIFGGVAAGIAVEIGTDDLAIYRAIYGSDPPDTVKIFYAKAHLNGRYCSLIWSAVSVNGCNGPTNFKVSSDGRLVAGEYYDLGCTGINFYMSVTTDTGVTGRSVNLLNNLSCDGSSRNQITPISENVYGYTGKITNNINPSILWTVVGGVIIGPDNGPTVWMIPDTCSLSATLTVTGACGEITTTITYPAPTIHISGTETPVNGSIYTVIDGGTPPYSWSITKGSISSDGVVSGIDSECGSAEISVEDYCGYTDSITVKLPGGSWQNSTTYSLMHGQDPTGMTIGEWAYINPVIRFKVTSVTSDHLMFDTPPTSCSPTMFVAGWTDNYYQQLTGYQRAAECCGGYGSGSFYPQPNYDHDHTAGCTADYDSWIAGGTNGDCGCTGQQWTHYASASGTYPDGCPAGISADGCWLTTLDSYGYFHTWLWAGRDALFYKYTCELQEWLC